MNRLWRWFTSYPMTRTGYAFTDIVSGRSVNYYRDRHGQHWMAESRWATFRVPAKRPTVRFQG